MLNCVEKFLKDFEKLSAEEKNRKANEELSVEEIDILHENGYDITVNDGICTVNGHFDGKVNETANAKNLNLEMEAKS